MDIVIGTVIVCMIAESYASKPPAAQEVCEANGGVANLDFTVKDINGTDVNLASLKGNVILLDFWATWCPPCRVEIPGFVGLYNTYKSRGLVVVGVSVDDSTEDVRKFIERYGMNYPVLMGYEREDLKQAFAPMPGFPTTFVIARDGSICSRHTGLAPMEQFESTIKALL
jgi:peroxiredoxin